MILMFQIGFKQTETGNSLYCSPSLSVEKPISTHKQN